MRMMLHYSQHFSFFLLHSTAQRGHPALFEIISRLVHA
jgi:hypothetical protein